MGRLEGRLSFHNFVLLNVMADGNKRHLVCTNGVRMFYPRYFSLCRDEFQITYFKQISLQVHVPRTQLSIHYEITKKDFALNRQLEHNAS